MTVRRADRVSGDRLAEIDGLAEEVSAEGIDGARVEPSTICRAHGITLSFGDYGDAFDGMLEHQRGSFHIYCNTARVGAPSGARARFTLGHELGHYFIDEHRHALASGRAPAHPSFCEYASANLVEREADQFAAGLLLPRARFLDAAPSRRPTLSRIIELADSFGASITATAIRYARIGRVPTIILKWTEEGLSWPVLSDQAFAQRFGRPISEVDDVPQDCPTGRALRAGEAGVPEGPVATAVTAWFPRVPWGARRNHMMIEQAVRLGSHGVLTMLYPEEGSFE